MKEKNIVIESKLKNGLLLEKQIRFGQTMKGMWYCKELSVAGNDSVVKDAEGMILEVMELLGRLNDK